MKKRLLFIVIFFCVNSTYLSAQRLTNDEDGPKGNIMLYGSLDYSKTNLPGNNNRKQFGTSPGAGIPLGIGYFINNNDLIGINYAFANDKINGNSADSQQEVGLWYSPSTMIGEHFLLTAQLDAHYVWGQATDTLGDLQDFTGYRIRAYPMLGVLMNKGWALKFKFGELSMLSTKPKKGGEKTSEYIAGLSGTTFGTGISKIFTIRKKK